jgi:hypothetical protein
MWFSTLSSCTPGYLNGYGRNVPGKESGEIELKDMINLAKKAPWGTGSQDYVARLESWRDSGKALQDLEVLA